MDHVISRDGTRIAYERLGDGPPLVIVASALADHHDAKRLARHLAEHFTVVNFDRRGRGASGDAPTYSVAREVDDIAVLIDAVGGPVTLFGSSSGAVLALDAAATLTDKVSGLALFEPPFIVDNSRPPINSADICRIEQLVARGERSEVVKEFMGAHMGMPRAMLALISVLPGWSKLKSLAHTVPYDLKVLKGTQSGTPLPQRRWQSVAAPTVAMVGEKSDAFLHVAARALATHIPGVREEVLAKANHSAVVATPKRLAALIVGSFAQGPEARVPSSARR
jgi:pimeloyl-ACP methyl ester carboxylesterase